MKRRGILRQMWASTPGKLGLAMATVLVVSSVLVVIGYWPLDYGPTRWSNPAVWADHPKAVPPAWTAAAGGDAVRHQITFLEIQLLFLGG